MLDFFDRYADRIQKAAPDECWVWTGAKTAGGYGHTHSGGAHVYAHRAAYESKHGVGSATGWVVRHTCDNPPCCNPAHLLIGTHSDNANDKIERGRNNPSKGEEIWTAQLTEADVLHMREMARNGASIRAITDNYHVTPTTVSLALRGITWGHLPNPVPTPPTANCKLTAEQVREIKARLMRGEPGVELAHAFQVGTATISAIKTGRNWAHVA